MKNGKKGPSYDGGKIHVALVGILTDIDAIGKTQENEKQKFKFRGIDDMYNAIHPLLKKHQVFIVPKVINSLREQYPSNGGGVLHFSIVDVEYQFMTTDGSFVTTTVRGEAMDSGDKATNKAMSACLKYALMQMFLIPTEDLKGTDADQKSDDVDAKQQLIDTVKAEVSQQKTASELVKYWETLAEPTKKIPEISTFVRDMGLKLKKQEKEAIILTVKENALLQTSSEELTEYWNGLTEDAKKLPEILEFINQLKTRLTNGEKMKVLESSTPISNPTKSKKNGENKTSGKPSQPTLI